MTNITTHITTLIYLHDCLIVPGLGAFIGNHQPAEIITEKGLFLPPKKTIGFNRSLQHNDGLLCDYISRAEGISFNDAQKLIDLYVVQIFESLANKQSVTIGEIGDLKKDAVGNILFWPNTAALFLPDSFGLTSFHIPLAQTTSKHNLLNKTAPHRAWAIKVSQKQWLVAVALFSGLFLLNNELQTPKTISSGSMVPTVLISEPAAPVEVETKEIEISNNTIVADKVELKESIEASIPNEPIKYYLVAASYPTNEPAINHMNKLVALGYANATVIESKGKNRVTTEGFTTREDAFNALEKYRTQLGFKDAWLLKIQ